MAKDLLERNKDYLFKKISGNAREISVKWSRARSVRFPDRLRAIENTE